MRRPSRRALLLGLKGTVTLVLVVVLGHRMLERDGVELLGSRLGALHIGWLAVAVLLHFAAVAGGVLRWRLLLRSVQVRLPLSFLSRSFLIGRFVGAFTPSTTGLDGWRIYDAGKRSGAMGKSATAVFVEKLVGLIGMSAVSAALLPFGGLDRLGPSALMVATTMGGAAVFGLVLMRWPIALRWTARRLPGPLRHRAERALEALKEARLSRSSLGRAVLLGMGSHLALSAVFFATARSVGVELDAAALLVVGNAIVLAVLLPVAIGGLGVREGVAVMLLSAAGVSSTDAMLVALLGYLTGQAPALIGGLAMAATRLEQRSAGEGESSAITETQPGLVPAP